MGRWFVGEIPAVLEKVSMAYFVADWLTRACWHLEIGCNYSIDRACRREMKKTRRRGVRRSTWYDSKPRGSLVLACRKDILGGLHQRHLWGSRVDQGPPTSSINDAVWLSAMRWSKPHCDRGRFWVLGTELKTKYTK